jgi:ribosomal protein S12 methylthiotransferase
VPEELREERRGRVMLLQEEISKARLKAKVGKTIRVLIDELTPTGAIGRSAADAPEIDGVVHVKKPFEPNKKLAVGQFYDVEVTRADAHDLWAEA